MAKKDSRNTRGRIINAAWQLFYEQGYEDTTIEEIIDKSQTSKGSFYHYFEGKDALLRTLSYLFDEKYTELMAQMDPGMNSFDKLMYINKEVYLLIENSVSLDLLARLLSSQLITKGEKHLLDRNRVYYKVLRQIVTEGQARGQIRDDMSVNEIVKAYAMMERALMYDWCLCGGEYSLSRYAQTMLPLLMGGYRKNEQ